LSEEVQALPQLLHLPQSLNKLKKNQVYIIILIEEKEEEEDIEMGGMFGDEEDF